MPAEYTYDTEFHEDGKTIELISIGIVRIDAPGEYYAVNADVDYPRAWLNPWLRQNVLAQLPFDAATGKINTAHRDVKPKAQIAYEVYDFLTAGGPDPDLWAWYGAYDHVALAQLWGPMINLPKGLPMFTMDLKQVEHRSRISLPDQTGGNHSAIEDARYNRIRHRLLTAAGAL